MSGEGKAHSPTPWRACQEGKCKCGQIWTLPGDHPVAVVEIGPRRIEIGRAGERYRAAAVVAVVPTERLGTEAPHLGAAHQVGDERSPIMGRGGIVNITRGPNRTTR